MFGEEEVVLGRSGIGLLFILKRNFKQENLCREKERRERGFKEARKGIINEKPRTGSEEKVIKCEKDLALKKFLEKRENRKV